MSGNCLLELSEAAKCNRGSMVLAGLASTLPLSDLGSDRPRADKPCFWFEVGPWESHVCIYRRAPPSPPVPFPGRKCLRWAFTVQVGAPASKCAERTSKPPNQSRASPQLLVPAPVRPFLFVATLRDPAGLLNVSGPLPPSALLAPHTRMLRSDDAQSPAPVPPVAVLLPPSHCRIPRPHPRTLPRRSSGPRWAA